MSTILDFTGVGYTPANPVTLSFGLQPTLLDSGAYTLSAPAASITSLRYLFAATDNYTLSASTTSITRQLLATASQDLNYTLVTTEPNIYKGVKLEDVGVFTQTRYALTFITQRRLPLDTGDFLCSIVADDVRPQNRKVNFSGKITLTYSGGQFDARPKDRVFSYQSLVYTLTPKNTILKLPARLVANNATMAISMGNFRTVYGRYLVANSPGYTLVWQSQQKHYVNRWLYANRINLHSVPTQTDLIKRVLNSEGAILQLKTKSEVSRRFLFFRMSDLIANYNLSIESAQFKKCIVLEGGSVTAEYLPVFVNTSRVMGAGNISLSNLNVNLRYLKEPIISKSLSTSSPDCYFLYDRVEPIQSGEVLYQFEQFSPNLSLVFHGVDYILVPNLPIKLQHSRTLDQGSVDISNTESYLNYNRNLSTSTYAIDLNIILNQVSKVLDVTGYATQSTELFTFKNYTLTCDISDLILETVGSTLSHYKVFDNATAIVDSNVVSLKYSNKLDIVSLLYDLYPVALNRLVVCGSLNLTYLTSNSNTIHAIDLPATQVRFVALT